MSGKDLGRLQKVELREAWSSEAGDFTPWLAKEENLSLLGEAIGIDLELEAQEKDVGPFRADILCKDTTTDEWVLIENQLERTDHKHLGQLLTYAAGLNAVTVIWVAAQFTEEHRATLDWLNERTDEKIKLFGLEIELWRIGDSPVAPKFNIVSQPNDWFRRVQQGAIQTGEISSHRQLQLKFWTEFKQYMEERKSTVRCQKPYPQSFYNHSLGRSGAHLASVVTLWQAVTGKKGPEIRVELYLDSPRAKEEFAWLEKQRVHIESELGFPLTWYNAPNKAACRLYVKEDMDFQRENEWPVQFEWLRIRLEKMHQVLAPLLKICQQETEG